jgi:glutathione S-transferase
MLIDEGGFDFAAYPRLRAWLARLQSRPAWRRVAEMILVS